ncbi:unnamed protein product, partial [Phaeothamnion confervicola]
MASSFELIYFGAEMKAQDFEPWKKRFMNSLARGDLLTVERVLLDENPMRPVALPTPPAHDASPTERAAHSAALAKADKHNEDYEAAERRGAALLEEAVSRNEDMLGYFAELRTDQQRRASVVMKELTKRYKAKSGKAMNDAMRAFTLFELAPGSNASPIVIQSSFNKIRRQLEALGTPVAEMQALSRILEVLGASDRWASFARRCRETNLATSAEVFEAMADVWSEETIRVLPTLSIDGGGGGG